MACPFRNLCAAQTFPYTTAADTSVTPGKFLGMFPRMFLTLFLILEFLGS